MWHPLPCVALTPQYTLQRPPRRFAVYGQRTYLAGAHLGCCYSCVEGSSNETLGTSGASSRDATRGLLEAPGVYAALMERACGGHALFHPRSGADMGGDIGDVGFIDKGIFTKLFNVFDSLPSTYTPPGSPQAVVQPTSLENGIALQSTPASLSFSSHGAKVEETNTSSTLLPLVSPANQDAIVHLQQPEREYAFLAFAGPEQVRKGLTRRQRDELLRWLVAHDEPIRNQYNCEVVLVTDVVQVSGWFGAVLRASESEKTSHAMFGGSAPRLEKSADLCEYTRGPSSWSPGDPPTYTAVLGYSTVRRRNKSPMPSQKRRNRLVEHILQRVNWTVIPRPRILWPSGSSKRKDTTESYESTLTSILDNTLAANPDVAAVAADWSLLKDWLETYDEMPDRLFATCLGDKVMENGGTLL
ncbi:hypothetical protein EXIGLDRAFT_317120 [Exidia glandulosa HHB12029]|uniref:Uncharacterized protein n=1 Tax=Exidia glandulosa HHB12029 TaxID=1314781 RepID=A0A165ZJS9_EXIGL|nr:hypothetical protein EXIGLDRAFT_317120 [Exidia glandulosa HHB12029]